MKSEMIEYIVVSRALPGEMPENTAFFGFLANKGIANEMLKHCLEHPDHSRYGCSLAITFPDREKSPGTIFYRKPKDDNDLFNKESGNILWICEEKFRGQSPDWLEIKRDKHDRSIFWKRVDAFGDASISGEPRLSRGLLYKCFPEDEHPKPPATVMPLNLQAYDSKPSVDRSDETAPDGYLNPLMVRYSCGDDWPDKFTSESRNFCEQHREAKRLLDVIPRFAPDALLRHRLLEEFAKLWYPVDGESVPVVPKLLFGSKWRPIFIPFAILDEMGGSFCIDGFASRRPTTFQWMEPAEDLPAQAKWLADWCCENGDFIKKKYERTKSIARPVFAGQIASYQAVHGDIKCLRDLARLKTRGGRVLKYFGKMEQKNLTEIEKKTLDRLFFECNSPKGFIVDRFLGLLGRKWILPRSPVLVGLPDPPEIVEGKQRKVWEDFRTSNWLHLPESAVNGEKWWLDLVFPPEAESKSQRKSQPWNPDDAAWWYPFFRALFEAPSDFEPHWKSEASGVIGESKIGAFTIGGKSSDAVPLDSFRLN